MSKKTRDELQERCRQLKSKLNETLPGSPEEQELLEQIQIVEDQIEQLPDTELPEPDPLRDAYLRRLMKTSDRLDLSGIDRKVTDGEVETCLHLGAVYTALLTVSAEHGERGLAMERTGRERRLSALEQVNQHERLVLLGDPGSGKSTFVKFVAMCLAGDWLGDPHADLSRLTSPLPDEKGKDEEYPQQWRYGRVLPVLVILRDFAAKGLPPQGQQATAQHLWDFIAAELTTPIGDYAPHLQQHLVSHGGLILLDGLDEVPEAEHRRTQIKQAVEDFAATFHKCQIVVTSRTYAYQKQEWQLSAFAEAVLAPFTEGQIRRFVDRWYRHIAEVRGVNVENAQGQAELLKRAIFRSERLSGFAERPLLLTLMASLHAWQGGSLPEKRGVLYAQATDLLLDWWERSKVVKNEAGQSVVSQPSLTEVLRVGKEPLERVLHALAYHAHKTQSKLAGTADIPEKELVFRLMDICRNEDINPVLLVKHLSDRAGLLVPHGVGVYSFPHRTFQEYLTACYLTSQEDYPDNVAELVFQEPERWREVVLLAAARVSDAAPMIWALVEALCYQNVSEADRTSQDSWGALLAGQALAETANLQTISPRNQPKFHRVREWLVAILTEQQPVETPFPAVERALAGNILAQLGDSRSGVGVRKDGLPDIVWCEVPAGKFMMGSDPAKDNMVKDVYGGEWEQPQHEVRLLAYQMSRYPVTNAQYQAFVEAGGKRNQKYGGDFDLPNHPVVGVSWHDAGAFCEWLTLRLRESGELTAHQEIRFPTEAEWEKAARGTDGRIYPWGDEISPEFANYGDTGLGTTSTVGCFPRGISPYGCEDMAGNVYEWCLDWFDKGYYKKSPGENPQGPASGSSRVIRGGHWGSLARPCRAAFRNALAPDSRGYDIGFRLLRTPS